MKLRELLHAIPVLQVFGSLDVDVEAIAFDYRQAQHGTLFVAVTGVHTDGHLYIPKVVENNAALLVVEELPEDINEEVTYIQVSDSAYALGIIAGNFYGNPSQDLKLVGVTGTNGKTTVATLL